MDKPKFESVLCDTEEARSVHYQLRYQVYCRETGFEDPNEFRDGMEKDRHDHHSAHFVVRDPLNHQWMAAMRLVMAGQGRLPSEHYCNREPLPEKLLERGRLRQLPGRRYNTHGNQAGFSGALYAPPERGACQP